MSATKFAWAAGFIDGDGCIHAYRAQRKTSIESYNYSLTVTVNQIIVEPLHELREILGGNLSTLNSPSLPKPRNQWRLTGATAIARSLPELLPYLVGKRNQAQTMIDLCATFDPSSNRVASQIHVVRWSLIQQLKAQKRF